MAQTIELGEPVNASEREMIELLIERLPDPYWVVPNLTIDQNNHPYEYDAVVVAPHAVHVVEIKGWNGPVTAISSGKWQLGNGRFVENPLDLTTQKAKILASVTRELHLTTADNSETIREPYVQASLLCAGDEVTYDVPEEIRHQCLTPSDAVAYLMDPEAINVTLDSPTLYEHCTDEIAQHVAGRLDARDPEPPRYGNYQAIEPIDVQDDVKTYRAEHADFDDGRLYRIRAWFLSPYRLSPEEREAREHELRRSAEALNNIGYHEHLANIEQFGSEEAEFYEVIEWSERGTLGTAIQRGNVGRMSIARRLELLAAVARGLEAAADAGVTHRSLTPESILLDPGGTPTIIDFDLAHLPDASETVYGEAADEMVQSEYVAPELRSHRDYEIHPSSDLYSLGVIAVEMFIGVTPGMVGGWAEARPRLEADLDDMPETVGDDVVGTIEALRSADPDERPDDPGEVADQFETWVAYLESGDQPATTSAGIEPTIEPTDLEPGDFVDASTRVVERLYESDTSILYVVDNDILGGEYVLKTTPDAEGTDAEAPFRVFRQLRDVEHPGLVRLHWAGRIGNHQQGPGYLLMDRLDGETIGDILDREGPLPVERAIEWTRDVLGALGALHPPTPDEPGLLHRDVKPDNVVVDERPLLIDFDSVIAFDPDASSAEARDAAVGTLQYMPPDLADGGWDPSCDLFAVGCLLWQMIAGRAPWEGTAPSADVPADRLDEVRDDVSSSLADVVACALAPSRDDRFRRAEDFDDALASHLEDEPDPEPVETFDLEAARTEAREAIWGRDLVERFGTCEEVSTTVMTQLRDRVYGDDLPVDGDLERAFLRAEARATALERPLPEMWLDLYDELTEPEPPRPLSGGGSSDDIIESAPLELDSNDILVVADGLHLFEACRLAARAEQTGCEIDWSTWRAGATDLRRGQPGEPPADEDRRDPLAVAVEQPQSLPVRRITTRDSSASGGIGLDEASGEPLRVEIDLPVGRRGDANLTNLLDRRWRQLRDVLEAVVDSERRAWVTARYGTIYLGSGLRHSIGDHLGAEADAVRQRWANAFPHGRTGLINGELPPGDHTQPWREVDDLRFPVGRIAWPDPDAPVLQRGGMSLPERMLPLIRMA